MAETKEVHKIRTRADLENLVPGESVDIRIKSAAWYGKGTVYKDKKKTTIPRMQFIRQNSVCKNAIDSIVIDPSEGSEEVGFYVLTNHKYFEVIESNSREYDENVRLLKQAEQWSDPV